MKTAKPLLSGVSADIPTRKIGCVGPLSPLPYSEKIELFGTQNITHLESMLASISGIYSSMSALLSVNSLANTIVPGSTFDRYSSLIKSRIETIRRVVDTGSPLIVFVDHFKISEVQLNVRGGTIIRSPMEFLAPLEIPETEGFRGVEIDYCGPQIDADDYFLNLPYAYTFALSGASLKPFLRAPSRLENEKKIVGAYRRTEGGIIIFAPPIGDAGAFPTYCSRLLEFADVLMKETDNTGVPGWASRFLLKREADMSRMAGQHRVEAERQKQFAATLEDELSRSSWHSHLVASSGKSLEKAVLRAFTEIGIPCEEGPNDRADFVALWEGTILVGEVKGYDGAAKEGSLAQCKRWINEVDSVLAVPSPEWDKTQNDYTSILSRLGVNFSECPAVRPKVKGVIICNNYHELPPQERPDLKSRLGENFSDVLRANLKRSEVAAMTSFQLLGLMGVFRENSEEALRYIRELIQTDGVYSSLSDNSEFLVALD